MPFGGGEFGSEKILAVHEVDGFTFTEGSFKFGVICFPGHNLGVGAREICIHDHLAAVRDEHLTDIRQAEFSCFLGAVVNDQGW